MKMVCSTSMSGHHGKLLYIEMCMHPIAHVLIFMCIIRTKGLHVVNGDKLSICKLITCTCSEN